MKNHKVVVKVLTKKQCAEKIPGMVMNYGLADSPFGKLFVAESDSCIHYLAFSENIDQELGRVKKDWPGVRLRQDTKRAKETASAIFSNKHHAGFVLQMPASDFRQTVWQALLDIPAGKTASYQQIAETIGKPSASRAVGNAVAANPVAFLVPCHRVIQKNGNIGNYRWGADCKKAILAWEQGERI